MAGNSRPNFLVIIADDLGVDRVGAYKEHPNPGRTPNIDSLAGAGVLFRNAYANPLCSPTRATLLTGRYSYRTGVGSNTTFVGGGPSLGTEEVLLEEALVGYNNSFIGKWHLASGKDALHPNSTGIADYAGGLHNLLNGVKGGGSYYNWLMTENGQQSEVTQYATSWATDRAVAAISNLPEPWMVWVSFNAPHPPAHAPPQNLHSYDLVELDERNDRPVFVRAMIEAMDTEIGRLLRAIDDNTVVFFIGDNGTGGPATDAPFLPNHAKRTLYEGGINVPLIAYGPGIQPGAECTALVNTTDLFSTVLAMAGLQSLAEDSVSMLPYLKNPKHAPLREWAYSERFEKHDKQQAIRGPRYKLIRFKTSIATRVEFYDLDQDPWEQTNLVTKGLSPAERLAYEKLLGHLPLL